MALKIGSTSVSKMYKGSIEVTKGYLGSNLIYSSAPPAGSTPLTDSNFNTARDLWFTNQAQAEATYGLIGNWNTTAVTNMINAFSVGGVKTNGFNEDISGWDTSNVISMSLMMRNQSSFNQPIGSWDVSSVTAMWNAFNGMSSFNQDVSSWNVIELTTADNFFSNSNLSTLNYDLILIGWEANLQTQFPNGTGYSKAANIGFGNTKYTGGGSAASARASLISNFNWTITDGGVV